VFVIHGGPDGEFQRLDDHELLAAVRARHRLPERFILTVATLEPRKNLPFLIEAYRRFRRLTGTKLGLVIVGRAGWKLESLQPALRESGQEIVLTGFVPQRDLVALYNLAEVFVLPSLYEGFGLPPLEAMACGCPVIVSNRGSLPEVVADAGLLIDPENPDSLVRAIGRVEANQSLRDELARRGLKRAKQFSWKTSAVKTEEVYQQAARC
jgi:glycosyltransferase involved in cell wall biosynthesis